MDIKPGLEFGRWVVERRVVGCRGKPGGWFCTCRCGNTDVIQSSDLRTGRSKSCGCLKSEQLTARNTTHGLSKTPEYAVWCNIIQRCTNPNATHYDGYGGRGITFDSAWESFERFLSDMGPRPSPRHTVERKDVNGPYSSDNCVWLLGSRQGSNTRRTRWITVGDRRQSLQDWCRETGLKPATVLARLKLGWSEADAVTTPARPEAKVKSADPLAKEKAARLMMMRRCRDETNKDYGGRGLTVHPAWVESFAAFLADVGPAPSAAHTLHRIKNDRGYEPGNVAWATKTEQARCRRSNRLLTFQGVTRTVAEWSEVTGISETALNQRLNVYHWPVERALTEPSRPRSSRPAL